MALNHCPLCLHPIYRDPDGPHVLACVLRYGVWARTGDDPRWHLWWRET